MHSITLTASASASAADGLLDPVVFALRQAALSLFASIVARDTEAIRAAVREEPRVVKTAAKFRGREAYAVEVAAMMDNGSAVAVLAEAGADLNLAVRGSPVYTAVTMRSHGALRALLAHKANPDLAIPGSSSDTALHSAVRLGDAAMTHMLLSAGAMPSQLSLCDTPLHIACALRRTDLASLLIAAGANVNVIGSLSPLENAARSGDLEIVTLLIGAGADVNLVDGSGRSALSMASMTGDLKVSTYLLDHGADPNCANGRGEPPLLLALQRDHRRLARLLFQRGADPNFRIYDLPQLWDSILHRLAVNSVKSAEASDTFMEFDPKLDILNSSGRTPLMAAVAHGNQHLTRVLLERGADVNHVSNGSQRLTALHAAVLGGYHGIVALLLEWGADPRVSEEDWPSVLDLARTSADTNISRLIMRRPEKLK